MSFTDDYDTQHRNIGGQVGPHTMTVSMAIPTGETVTVTRVVMQPRNPDTVRRSTRNLIEALTTALDWPAEKERAHQ